MYILFPSKCNTGKVFAINILSSAVTTSQDCTMLELQQMQTDSQDKTGYMRSAVEWYDSKYNSSVIWANIVTNNFCALNNLLNL